MNPPGWSRDGQHVIFRWLHDGRYVLASQSTDGSAPPKVIVPGQFFPSSWASGGHLLGVIDDDLAVATFGNGAGTVAPVRQTADLEGWPEVSPDGRWLAYASNASGRIDVYVQRHPLRGGRTPVSVEGGADPAWHPNGRELFYITRPNATGQRRMMAAPFDPGTGRIGTPRALFEFDEQKLTLACLPTRCYDVAPDGQRFFGTQTPAPPRPPEDHADQPDAELVRGAEGEGAGAEVGGAFVVVVLLDASIRRRLQNVSKTGGEVCLLPKAPDKSERFDPIDGPNTDPVAVRGRPVRCCAIG